MKLLSILLVCFMSQSVIAAEGTCSANPLGACVCQQWHKSDFQVMYWDGKSWVALTNLITGLKTCIKTMREDADIAYICGK